MYNLDSISTKLIDNIDEILDKFDISYIENNKMISFACPIHGGDNPNGSSILKRDIGNWQCYTNQCHEQYGSSILHFMQALLSVMYNKKHTFVQTLEWCADFVGESINNTSHIVEDQTTFIQLCKYINRNRKTSPIFTPRELVRKTLSIPSTYYIKRKYSANILQKFDVGLCTNSTKPLYGRVIVPFYDDDGKYMVGYTGRTIHNKCVKCSYYHSINIRCPITRQEKLTLVKWKHNSNFNGENYLYNFWNAKQYISDNNTVILVEGTGDVWKFEEAGVYNSVALLKAKLSDGQQRILEESGCINIIVATDNDKAGNLAYNSIIKQCGHIFNIRRLEYPGNDPGDLTIEQIKNFLTFVMEKL